MNITIDDIKEVIQMYQTAPLVPLTDDVKVNAARSLMERIIKNTQDDEDEAHDKSVLAELNEINNSYPVVEGSGVPAPDVEGAKQWRNDGILTHDKALASDVAGWESTRAKIFAGIKVAASVALSTTAGPAAYLAALKSIGDLLQEASANI